MKKILKLPFIILLAACSSEKTGDKASEAALLIDETTINTITEKIKSSQPSADQDLHAGASYTPAVDDGSSRIEDFNTTYA